MVVRVVVNGPRGEKETIDLCDTEEQLKSITVLQLKEKIFERWPAYRQDQGRLIHVGKLLDEDSSLLSEYGIRHMSVIQIIFKVSGGGGDPGKGDSGMGDKDGKNRSMERLVLL